MTLVPTTVCAPPAPMQLKHAPRSLAAKKSFTFACHSLNVAKICSITCVSVVCGELPMHHFFEGLMLDLCSVPWVVGGWEQGLKEGRYKEFKTSKIQYGVY